MMQFSLSDEIGQIAKANYATTSVFKKYAIDYYSNGEVSLQEAAEHAGIRASELITELNEVVVNTTQPEFTFAEWPLTLLLDYILRLHHQAVYDNGPVLLQKLQSLAQNEARTYPFLTELAELFEESINDLTDHLQKEENVLFPYFTELYDAYERHQPIEAMHCGSVQNPIGVMHMEHSNESQRYAYIQRLTNNYHVPEGATEQFEEAMTELRQFMNRLIEHIHLENNILFPAFIKIENESMIY